MLLQSFGHLPANGEKTQIEDYHFEIVEADNRRIISVRVTFEPALQQDEQAKEEQRKAEFIEKTQEKREYDLKLQGCIEQQKTYQDSLEAKGQLYSIENGKKVDNSFKLLSAECKMMIIRSEKESDNESAKQEINTTEVSS